MLRTKRTMLNTRIEKWMPAPVKVEKGKNNTIASNKDAKEHGRI
jgi:hypothetical protein